MRRTALAMVVLLIGSVAAIAPAGAAASITVTPSTSLADGDTVHVSGSGFGPLTPLVSAECSNAPATPNSCDLSNVLFLQADETGAYSFDFVVHSTLHTGEGFVNCTSADGACVIAVADSRDTTGTAVTAPISFTPPGPPQGGVLHVPTAPVAAEEGIDVTATDFAPNALIVNSVCAADATTDVNDCDLAYGTIAADASGALAYSVFPPSTLVTQNQRSLDCTIDGTCVYAAWDSRDFAATLTTAPVRIAPEVPGSLTVTPSTDLRDGGQVTLSGTGWPASLELEFTECDGPGATALCSNFLYASTDSDGAFSTPYAVRSVSVGARYIDCETGPCWIHAAWYPNPDLIQVLASQPITFDLTPTPVTSHYTADELAAVAGAASTLGISSSEVQHLGSWALAFVLAITHTGAITPAPDSGPGSLTTDWLPSEYEAIKGAAAAHGTSFEEFQKTGALFLAYVLAIA
jgi:hypothetical protein